LQPAHFLERPRVFSLNVIFDEAIRKRRLYGLRLDGFFMHVGDPEALREAELALKHICF
jgi:N-acetyl-alpha-D-muramate 1-phosphate uridylyltransferase